MQHGELVNEINKNLALDLSGSMSLEELLQIVAEHVNKLIQKDFQKLIYVLYRVDVNEAKLKQLLQQHAAEDAGRIIATLIVERQLEKIKSRSESRAAKNDISEDEKW